MKIIFLIIVLLTTISTCDAADTYVSTTNIEYGAKVIGGNDLITPKPQFNDTFFIISNEGTTDFIIYMYNYTGNMLVENLNYTNSIIAYIEPGEYTIVPRDAQYSLYGSYNEIRDITDVEVVKKKFNQWWLIIIIVVVLLIAGAKIGKAIIR